MGCIGYLFMMSLFIVKERTYNTGNSTKKSFPFDFTSNIKKKVYETDISK